MRREETEDEQEMKKEGRQKGFPVSADAEQSCDSQSDGRVPKRTGLSRWLQLQGRDGDSITNQGRLHKPCRRGQTRDHRKQVAILGSRSAACLAGEGPVGRVS